MTTKEEFLRILVVLTGPISTFLSHEAAEGSVEVVFNYGG